MGQFKDISIKDVMEEINVSYFLPDIQREYVWLDNAKERKIEQLFDSIMRDYRLTRQSPWQGLTKHQRYPIEKERNVPYPTQLASKSLQLGIERFCRCVGSA